jgi:hypothetical protein
VIEVLLSGCFAYSPDRKCFWGAPADQQDNIFSIHKKNVTLKLTFCCHQHSRGKKFQSLTEASEIQALTGATTPEMDPRRGRLIYDSD